MTLSTPVKVIALAGLALILGMGGVVLLLGHKHPAKAPSQTPAPVQVIKVTPTTTHHVSRPVKPKLRLDPSLPAAVHAKLVLSREVVAFVYTGASARDRAQLSEVRAGAHAARVPFVALDVSNEQVASSVFPWLSSSADPQTVVVRRPGKVSFQLAGLTDRQTVAQAALDAR
jgi:hypothetical protein